PRRSARCWRSPRSCPPRPRAEPHRPPSARPTPQDRDDETETDGTGRRSYDRAGHEIDADIDGNEPRQKRALTEATSDRSELRERNEPRDRDDRAARAALRRGGARRPALLRAGGARRPGRGQRPGPAAAAARLRPGDRRPRLGAAEVPPGRGAVPERDGGR